MGVTVIGIAENGGNRRLQGGIYDEEAKYFLLLEVVDLALALTAQSTSEHYPRSI